MSPNTKRLAVLCASVSLAVLAGACTTVGPNFAQPNAPRATGYAAKGEATPPEARLDDAGAAAGPWWTAFGSPALDATIRQALADSPTLAEAEATLRQSQSALAQARGVAGPQVDATAGVNRERANLQAFGFTSFGDVTLSNPTFNLYSVGGSVGYDLDLFGGARRRIEGAGARVEAQARRAEAAYLTLTANVALQTLTIATLNAQIEAVNQMIVADQANIDLVRHANALGGSTATARVSAQSQMEQDRALLPSLQGQLAAARHALALLAGRAPADWTAPDFTLADLNLTAPVPVALPSVLVRRRPDILAAEADLHAATADIGVATADLYPNIKLTASLTQGSLKPGDIFSYDATAWNVGAGLTAPIFNGGALKARRQQAREAATASSARYQQTVLTAFAQVADALSALAADDDAIAAYGRSEGQAGESLRLARVAYDQGGGTLLEVLDAQRRVHEVRASRVRAQGQRLADAVRLFAASGADWRTRAS
ncbi:efflux transporter, outer membrane factor lipoprotein, NodT family [Caulobacter sp. AP07]|uniref:efflux transporter outer membrane subunit n=1 Tax=Caulobacter sp. AP07 TaxID=1144304 RepID=UPI0002722512|nr:efflux transporter outer membrane subunit [Caulobacter sp. AP07]EJL33272.1 efflux transporter, outer membrane factor lipoprotein, NodT family [Caulobacter sp. AP07]